MPSSWHATAQRSGDAKTLATELFYEMEKMGYQTPLIRAPCMEHAVLSRARGVYLRLYLGCSVRVVCGVRTCVHQWQCVLYIA